MKSAYLHSAALTSFGEHPGKSSLDLMSMAAQSAINEGGLEREGIDGVICGYAGTHPHIMFANVFAEHFGLKPGYLNALQMGGATGIGMVMLATRLVQTGQAENILVVAGENRATGQSRASSVGMLSQIGHPRYEVPLGATVPAYYALLAAQYLHQHDLEEADLAELAVLMRTNAGRHSGAHMTDPIEIDDVLASAPIATPLKLLDCCPISDGGAAIVVSSSSSARGIKIAGAGQAHHHQHLSQMSRPSHSGALQASVAALNEADAELCEIDYAGIYDSFTITLALLLEEIGFSGPGCAPQDVRDGRYSFDGPVPLNTHGGLLSYGQCGVAGALSHLCETRSQMLGEAGDRQLSKPPSLGLVHADGGVLSAHVSLVLERTQ